MNFFIRNVVFNINVNLSTSEYVTFKMTLSEKFYVDET